MSGGGDILNGGIAAAVSAVLVALIQTRSLTRTPKEATDPAVALRRELLEFAELVDTEAGHCTDVKAAARLQVAARAVRAKLVES